MKLRRSEFYNNVSAKDRVQEMNLNQTKVKINDTYKKDEKIPTNFEPSHNEDVIHKGYLDTKLSEVEGHLLLIEKDYNEFKLRNDKQSEEILFQRAVKTIMQILYDKGLFDNYNYSDEVLKDYLLIDEGNERRRPDLEALNDDDVVILGFCS